MIKKRRALAIALSVLKAFQDNSAYEDYQREDAWNDDDYAETLILLEELVAKTDKETVALKDLVNTINFTGGVTRDDSDNVVPVVDTDWVDLGAVYLQACKILGTEPAYTSEEDLDA